MKYFFLAACALFLGGCSLSSNYKHPQEFDLAPVKVKFSRAVSFSNFTNLSGSDRRFLLCDGSQTTRAEYSRWISNPDLMLMRALASGVPDSVTDKPLPRCNVVLYRFNWCDGSAYLVADVTLLYGKNSSRWMFQTQEKCTASNADARVAAMNQCVERLAVSLQEKLEKLPEER